MTHPKAALLFHWKSLRRQVRLEGPVSPTTPAEADAYFATRERGSQAERGGCVGPAAPRPPLGLPEETTGAGGGQNPERAQAQEELRKFMGQVRVPSGQQREDHQHGKQPKCDRRSRSHHNTDQNGERTHLKLVYTWTNGIGGKFTGESVR